MRVTGGNFRSRVVRIPDIQGVRPTSSKVRQALFNILGDIEGCSGLDLFSGSGIMAIEALSRGASSMTSIEAHPAVYRALQQSREVFQLQEHWNIHKGTLPHRLNTVAEQSFDFIFADPPYAEDLSQHIPTWLNTHHIRCHCLIIEASSRTAPLLLSDWNIDSRTYGDTRIDVCMPFKS